MKKQNIIIGIITFIVIAGISAFIINDQNKKKEERFNNLIVSHINRIETMMSEENMHKTNVENIYTRHINNMQEPMRNYEHSCKRYYACAISLNKHMDAFTAYHDIETKEYYAMCHDIGNEIDPYRDSLDKELQRAKADYELYMLAPYDSFEKKQTIVQCESIMKKAEGLIGSLSFENFKKQYIDKFFKETDEIAIDSRAKLYAYLY